MCIGEEERRGRKRRLALRRINAVYVDWLGGIQDSGEQRGRVPQMEHIEVFTCFTWCRLCMFCMVRHAG